jgi:hypothetical protein
VEEEAANVSEALRIAHFPETNYILNDPACDIYFNHGKLSERLASAVKVRSTGRSNVSANTTSVSDKSLPNGGVQPGNIPDDVVNVITPEIREPSLFLSKNRHSAHTSEDLSQLWSIGLQQAQMTLDATERRGMRSAVLPLSRRYRHDRWFGRKMVLISFMQNTKR